MRDDRTLRTARRALDFGQPLAQLGSEPTDAEAERQDREQVRQRWHAGAALLELRHAALEVSNGLGVRTGPGVNLVLAPGHIEQDSHPDVGHEYIRNDHRGQHGVRAFGHLPERHEVRPATDPASAKRGHAPPDVVGKPGLHDPERNGSADHDAERAGQQHDPGLGTEPDDPGRSSARIRSNSAAGRMTFLTQV